MCDLLATWGPYAAGYGFAVLGGHLLPPSTPLWKRNRREPYSEKENPVYDPFIGRVMGLVERPLYVAAFLAKEATFVGIWLGLKVAGGWKGWEKGIILANGKEIPGRIVFNIMLIGSAVSVAYGWVGAQMTRSLQHGDTESALVTGLALLVAHVSLYGTLVLLQPKNS